MPEQFDCPTAANSQFDINAIDAWEAEGSALPRHTYAGSAALPAFGGHPLKWPEGGPWPRRARFRRAVLERL